MENAHAVCGVATAGVQNEGLTMVEYIEREAAYALSKIICDAIRNREYHPANFGRFILDRIDDIPAADVQPVRHGRWERTSKSLMVCTACGNCVVDDRISGMFYCPNCGAKMDKEEE